ncbi:MULTISPECIES: glycosyltransferase [unclassified Pseudoalteromonas]|uniref:glycosyltransferase n=1 Tax=unclassified Pseudoalteromonas TaxID=194690 RepID=UPI000400C618|nr:MULTISPECIES: glycosyltransferase [unclassified Pseudoalteromonas]
MLSDKSLLLNFLPVKTGGGLQNSLSFLSFLKNDSDLKDVATVLTYKGSEIYKVCINNNIRVHSIKPGLLSRLKFEIFLSRRLINSDTVIFTLFGPPLITKKKSVTINGCAYSNLFYPEIGFWSFLPYPQRFLKYCIDFYRKVSLSKAQEIIFETKILLERASKDKLFVNKKLHLVQMSPSSLVCESNVDASVALQYKAKLNSGYINLLYISGPHPNKRHYLWPRIIKSLKMKGLKVCLVTTLPTGDYLTSLSERFSELGLNEHLVNVGPVKSEHVASLISIADGLTNLALLESFSNNFVEAWEMKKPLIVTDADWSRGCCGKGAIYIDPLEAELSADRLLFSYTNVSSINFSVQNGSEQLSHLPSKIARYNQFKSIIMDALK